MDQHKELKEYSEECGIEYSTSVWDLASAKEITSLQPKFIKIPSACNNHYKMLAYLCDNFNSEIQVPLGMTSRGEEENLIRFFEDTGRNRDLVIYSCTFGYPVPFENVCLMEIKRLIGIYGSTVKEVRFSGHHLGIAIDIAAYTLGASIIERHRPRCLVRAGGN